MSYNKYQQSSSPYQQADHRCSPATSRILLGSPGDGSTYTDSITPRLAWGSPAEITITPPGTRFPPPGQFVSPAPSPKNSNPRFRPPQHNPRFSHRSWYSTSGSPTPTDYQSPHSSPYSSYGHKPGSHGYQKRPSFHKSCSRDSDYSPGESNDIRDYYHPSMVEDPWKALEEEKLNASVVL